MWAICVGLDDDAMSSPQVNRYIIKHQKTALQDCPVFSLPHPDLFGIKYCTLFEYRQLELKERITYFARTCHI